MDQRCTLFAGETGGLQSLGKLAWEEQNDLSALRAGHLKENSPLYPEVGLGEFFLNTSD